MTSRLRILLTSAVVAVASTVLGSPVALAATSLSVGGPGAGTWQIGQMWHGGALGDGIVPAGTSIDLSPINGSPLDVHAVAAGRIVRTCVSPTQSTVFVDTPGLGVVGYSHLATGSVLTSGPVAKGQRLGRLATTFVASPCASAWTGPHLHLSLPARYDELRLAGQTASRYAVLEFGTPAPKAFVGSPSSSLTVTPAAARLVVCADNLTGNVVRVRLSRAATTRYPATAWTAARRASSRCVRFEDLDGSGGNVSGTTYVARAAINQTPSATWPVPCFRATNGQGICTRTLY